MLREPTKPPKRFVAQLFESNHAGMAFQFSGSQRTNQGQPGVAHSGLDRR